MALKCIPADVKYGSQVAQDRRTATIVLESDAGTPSNFTAAIEELQSREAKDYAISCAAHWGLASPSLNGLTSAPYAVNAAGVPLVEVVLAPGEQPAKDDPRFKVARYRSDVPVMARI